MTNSDYQNSQYFPMHVLEAARKATQTLIQAHDELERAMNELAKAVDELSRNILNNIREDK